MRKNDLKRIAFIPDCHFPYVDKKAFALALRAIGHFRPHQVVILGDFGDFYCVSRHPKNPNRTRDLRAEVEGCNEGLDAVDALCAAVGAREKSFCMGNHEDMLRRFLEEKAPELFNLVSVEALFLLKARGWSVTPYNEHTFAGKLVCTHDTGFAGANAHVQSAAAMGTNTIIGHTHRLAVQYGSNIRGKHHVAAMAGWLGDTEMAKYLHKGKRTTGWQHGFAVGHQENNGTVHVTPIPIVDNRCVVNGVRIT